MEHRLDHHDRRSRVYRDSCEDARVLYLLQHAVDVLRRLGVYREQRRTSREEHIHEVLGGLGHHVDVEEGLGPALAQRLDERGAVGEVRDEVAVHYVDVEPVGLALEPFDVSADVERVGGEQRRRYEHAASLFEFG